ncbi:MAG: hypothetical protein KKH44_06965 [Bacteroidetes bacterium]|nr:hypothetical protein [Bacteroidota bacterium]
MDSLNAFFSKIQDRVGKYEELVDSDADKKELRQYEKGSLVPNSIPKYIGEKPVADELGDRSVLVVFPNSDSFKLFEKYFKVTKYVQNSLYRIDLLIQLLTLIENESLIIDPQTNEVRINN